MKKKRKVIEKVKKNLKDIPDELILHEIFTYHVVDIYKSPRKNFIRNYYKNKKRSILDFFGYFKLDDSRNIFQIFSNIIIEDEKKLKFTLKFKHIKSLSLFNCCCTDRFKKKNSIINNLKKKKLKNIHVSDFGCSNAEFITDIITGSLRSLIIDNIYDIILFTKKVLQKLDKLEVLYIRNMSYDIGYYRIWELKNLRILKIRNSRGVFNLNKIKGMSKLREFVIRCKKISAKSFNGTFENLLSFEIRYCGNFLNAKHTFNTFINLKKLKIIGCYKFKGKYLKKLKNLTELKVVNCWSFKGKDILYRIKSLKSLVLFDCPNLTISSLPPTLILLFLKECELVSGNKNEFLNLFLKILIVDRCSIFEGNGVQHLKSLEQIEIKKCPNYEGHAIKHLNKLESLIVSGCKNFCCEKVIYLPNIKVLKIQNCKKFEQKTGIKNIENFDLLKKWIKI
jgi:hypothetical protein